MVKLIGGKKHIIIKRKGKEEQFNYDKLYKVILWMCNDNHILADELIQDIQIKVYDKMRIQALFDIVIQTAVNKTSAMYPIWDEVAKRGYIQKIYKETWGVKRNTYPDYLEVVKKGVTAGAYDKQVINSFTDEEIEELGKYLKQERDFDLNYLGLKSMYNRYCFKSSKTKVFELPQHGFMRVALFAFWKEDKDIRLDLIKQRYDDISQFYFTEATPKWINSLKYNPQMSSCVIMQPEDTAEGINSVDNALGLFSKFGGGVAWDMSLIRSHGADIGKLGKSNGKIPFLKKYEATISAYNQQGVRKGAGIAYYNWWDIEVKDLLILKEEGGVEEQRARKLQYGVKVNEYLLKKVLEDGFIYLFDPKDVPNLLNSFGEEFDKYYDEYCSKTYIRKTKIEAVELIEEIIKQRVETGNIYIFFDENVNTQNMFMEYINSSNLCVVGDTKVLTKEYGHINIKEIDGKELEAWNGEQWSLTKFAKTSNSSEIFTVKLNNGVELRTTDYHRWSIYKNGSLVIKKTKELIKDDIIEEFTLPNNNNEVIKNIKVVSITKDNVSEPTYCGSEPLRNKLIFNGVMTMNCAEITLPTKPLTVGNVKLLEDLKNNLVKVEENDDIGEIALCNLSSVNIYKFSIMSYEEKYRLLYNLLRASDNLIDYAYYPLVEGEISNKFRRSIGLGVVNYAYFLTKNEVLPDSEEAEKLTYQIFEELTYITYLVSNQLAVERGKPKWYNKTKYSRGILPKDVSIVAKEYEHYSQFDWGKIRELGKTSGFRFSVHFAIAPTSTSGLVAGVTEGIDFPKDYISIKADGKLNEKQLLPEIKKLRANYKLVWDISNKVIINLGAIRQIFLDQSQSLSLAYTKEKTKDSSAIILADILYAYKKGIKTLYYHNTTDRVGEVCESCV